MKKVYAYGMCVWSSVYRVEGSCSPGDGYGEITEQWQLPAGEATNGAMLLSRWGMRVQLAGSHLGRGLGAQVVSVLEKNGVDASELVEKSDFKGYRDQVITGPTWRSVFGYFQRLSQDSVRHWQPANPQALEDCQLALLDPCFGQDSTEAARLCHAAGTPYVTLDCRSSQELHHLSAATVLSSEFLHSQYPDAAPEQLFEQYVRATKTEGLVVMTSGLAPVRFGRTNTACQFLAVAAVPSRISIGAGDSFRAGIAYGLLQSWGDKRIVEFAIAAAASVCRSVPVGACPPSLEQIARG